MSAQPRPVRVKLSAEQVRRVRRAATTGTIATAAEVAARVAAASVLGTFGGDAAASDKRVTPGTCAADPGG